MFYFELRNAVSVPGVLSTHSNGNNIKKVFWKINFYKLYRSGIVSRTILFFQGFLNLAHYKVSL